MEGLMDVVVKVMNSPVIQGVLTSASFLQIIAEALEKRRENRDTLETQAVYCFERALYQFCTHYEMEYDCVQNL